MKHKNRRRLKLTKSFYSAFALLFAIILVLFLAFTGYSYLSSRSAMHHEFMTYSQGQLQSIASTVDSHMRDMRYVMATLYMDYSGRAYMTMADPDALLSGTTRTLTDQLMSYLSVFPHLDSAYVYSPANDLVLSANREETAASLADNGWMDYINGAADGSFQLLFRKKSHTFPYLVTLLKTLETEYGTAAVCVNVNFAQMEPLNSYSGQSTETIYIVSDSGQILYRYGQDEYLEPVSVVPELASFDADQRELQLYVSEKDPYIYTQYHSERYPWSYVLVTQITDYTAQLSNSTNYLATVMVFIFVIVVFLIFLITFRSARPIGAIVRLLESPEDFTYAEISDKENQEIIQKIMTYIQTNSILSQELEAQLEQLNEARMLALQSQINPHFLMNTLNTIRMLEIEELGYDHRVPEMTLILSRLLQYALDSTDCVSVSTEMHYAELFAQLLNLRYQNTIHCSFGIDDDAKHVLIPKLIIQPLIENSVFHGLSSVSDQRDKRIFVTVQAEEERCILTVADNGTGMDPQKLALLTESISEFNRNTPNSSIGLRNVILRMHLLYGDVFSYEITSTENEGTSVVFRFPTALN